MGAEEEANYRRGEGEEKKKRRRRRIRRRRRGEGKRSKRVKEEENNDFVQIRKSPRARKNDKYNNNFKTSQFTVDLSTFLYAV